MSDWNALLRCSIVLLLGLFKCLSSHSCVCLCVGWAQTVTPVVATTFKLHQFCLMEKYILPSSAGGGPVRLPGAMCLPHTNNMDSKLQGSGSGGGATLRPRAGGVPLEPFIHQVRGKFSKRRPFWCCWRFSRARFAFAGGGSHEYDALRWPHGV